MPFLEKIKKQIIYILSCCNRPEPKLQIGSPTDFRRGDITIEGLTDEQQAFIREKAIADASRMFNGHPPSPLPSPTFASFPHGPQPHVTSKLNRARQHSRRLSNRFCSYHPVYTDNEPAGSSVMLREQEGHYSPDSVEDQTAKALGDWADGDSVTWGGSERSNSEKSAMHVAELAGRFD